MPEAELEGRLRLIEEMVREGRQTMGRWGWVFVLWGVGHLSASLWTHLSPGARGLPWLILMPLCGVIMGAGALLLRRREGKTTALDRIVGGVWWAFGISLALFWGAGGSLGLYPDTASFLFVFYVLIGAANLASGTALKLSAQKITAGLWWGGALLTVWFPDRSLWVLMAAALICEIGFGLHLMRRERQEMMRGQVAGA